MDLNEFWQENKRWVLGVGLGFVLFLIGKAILGSLYSADSVVMETQRILRGGSDAMYDTAARVAAQKTDKALREELARLREALEFHPDPQYSLEGKGVAPDAFLTQQGRELKKRMTTRADALDVILLDKDLSWSTHVVVDDIRRTLLGLDVVDQAASRLLAAHERVRGEDPDAIGLRAIQQFKVEDRAGGGSSFGLRPIRSADRRQRVDLSELLSESKVSFQFQADAATTLLFLESLKNPANPLALEEFSITQGTRPDEPLTVKGKLLALVFKEQEQEQEVAR